jgi:hypothetical protein
MQSPEFDPAQGSLADLVVQQLARLGVTATCSGGCVEADGISLELTEFSHDFNGALEVMLEQLDQAHREAVGEEPVVPGLSSFARVSTPNGSASYASELMVGDSRFRLRASGW